MKVLVAYASKYGSTGEIAAAIGRELDRLGHHTEVCGVAGAPPPTTYDAAVLGSGVYMGSWLPAASRYLDAHAAALADMPVWLFSSGPLGFEDPQPAGEPQQVAQLIAKTAARGHVTLTGRLERDALRLMDRLIVRAVKAPAGDFRDWDAIRTWAGAIGEALADPAASRAAAAPSAAIASRAAAAPSAAATARQASARGGS